MAYRLVCALILAASVTLPVTVTGLHAQTPDRGVGTATVAAAAKAPAIGSYVSSRLNGKPLPMKDRASDDRGVQYLIEFEELILTLRGNQEFRASLRYRQTLAAKGDQVGNDPIQKMTVYGTWSAVGNELRFVPDPKRGGSGLRILSGTFSGTRIEVPFDYQNGSVARQARVSLVKDDRIL